MAKYQTPGVYVEEMSTLPPSVAGVATAIPAFIGFTEKALPQKDEKGIAVKRISNMLEYEAAFGRGARYIKGADIAYKVKIETKEDKTQVITYHPQKTDAGFHMYDSVRLFFANGGSSCYVISVGQYGTDTYNYNLLKDKDKLKEGLTKVEDIDEVTLICMPDAFYLSYTDFHYQQQTALAQAGNLHDRIVLLDLKDDNVSKFRNGNIGSENLEFGSAYTPNLNPVYTPELAFLPVLAAGVGTDNYKILLKNGDEALTTKLSSLATDGIDILCTLSISQDGKIDIPEDIGIEKITLISKDSVGKISSSTKLLHTNQSITIQDFLNQDFLNQDFKLRKGDTLQVIAHQKEQLTAKGDAQEDIAITVALNIPEETNKMLLKYKEKIDGSDKLVNKCVAFNKNDNAWECGDTTIKLKTTGTGNNAKTTVDFSAYANQDKVEEKISVYYYKATAIPNVSFTEEEQAMILRAIPECKAYADRVADDFYTVCPPSGAIAGIMAKTDRYKGVWSAPANVSVSGIKGITRYINDDMQSELNAPSGGGKPINAIRAFTGKGFMVWGARTLDGINNEWRYVSVRRLFNYVEESIKKSTAWAVFQPNNPTTWAQLQGQIENFLTELWRLGALVGANPEDAFFVRVGKGESMTEQQILEGELVVMIGLAVVRPAEFVILQFSHKVQK